MSDKVKQTVVPHLVVKGAAEALEFYAKAFGATEQVRMPGPGGLLWHASMDFGGDCLYLCDEFPDGPMKSPTSLGGSPVTIHLNVADIDAAFARAVEAGATPEMPPMDMFWGARFGKLVDPFGYHWSLSTPIEDVAPEEMRRRGAAMMAEMGSAREPEPQPA